MVFWFCQWPSGVGRNLMAEVGTAKLAPNEDKSKTASGKEKSRNEARKNFLLTGEGNEGGEHFENISNREFFGSATDQAGTSRPVEEMTGNERDRWLNGEDPPARKEDKQTKQPTAQGAPKETPADGKTIAEGFEDWTPGNLEQRIKTLPQRVEAQLKQHADHKEVSAAFDKLDAKLNGEPMSDGRRFMQFIGNVIAMTENPGNVARVLAKNPDLWHDLKENWESVTLSRNPKWQLHHEGQIKQLLRAFDNDPAAFPGGKKPREIPKLTRAGKPPVESAGGTSLPASDDDLIMRAAKNHDSDTYQKLMNKKEADARREKYGRRRR
jgi:hypothetical protein